MGMRFKVLISIILIVSLVLLGCATNKENYEYKLKKGCLEATIIGIKLDIGRLEGYLKLPDLENREQVLEALSKLKEDLKKYESMKVEDYVLPEPIIIRGFISEPYVEDTIIYLEKQSKSGPFYHAVKVMDDRGSKIVPKEIYEFKIYPVYRRYYPFPDFYVFVESFKK
jgi:hypothetical protein